MQNVRQAPQLLMAVVDQIAPPFRMLMVVINLHYFSPDHRQLAALPIFFLPFV
jgi:hypothetical protein